jgi:chromosome segregation ATPase
MVAQDEFATKADLKEFKEEIIHEFRIVSEGLTDQIKLLDEGHSGVVQRLDRMDTRFDQVEIRLDRVETRLDHMETRLDRVEKRLDHMEKENERQHLETRALIKLSFSELDKRLTDLESQVKELQEWRKQIQSRLQI